VDPPVHECLLRKKALENEFPVI